MMDKYIVQRVLSGLGFGSGITESAALLSMIDLHSARPFCNGLVELAFFVYDEPERDICIDLVITKDVSKGCYYARLHSLYGGDNLLNDEQAKRVVINSAEVIARFEQVSKDILGSHS